MPNVLFPLLTFPSYTINWEPVKKENLQRRKHYRQGNKKKNVKKEKIDINL